MSVKSSLQCITDSYVKVKHVLRYKSLLRSHYSNQLCRHYTVLARSLPNHLSLLNALSSNHAVCQPYSPTAGGEQKIKDYSENIQVQPIQFEDMSFDQPVPHSDLLTILQTCNSLEEQMEVLAATLALTEEDIKKRSYFCKCIETLLSPFFVDIKIKMFGSSVNGFGFKGCDIDMSFDTSAQPIDKSSYLERPDVPLVSEVLLGKISPLEISQLPKKEQLLFIHSVLLEYYKESNEPTIFINAYIPLVRFYHDKFNLKCDLSCGNKVAFANTKLLYFFGQLDKRVIPLMMTIRYWAKHVELIGKGLMFNTYTISMLVVYFLQTCNPPVLPSGEIILSLTDGFENENMDDTSFLNALKSIPASKNTQSSGELLREFFSFYLYFDFTRVICPLIAASVPRHEFFSGEKNKKFRMSTICVQDPLLLSHNVAELVDYKHCRKFCTELLSVCKIFQDGAPLTPASTAWGLMALLDRPEDYSLNKITTLKSVSFTIPQISNLNKDISSSKALNLAQTLVHILENALLFECKTLERSDAIKLLEKQDDFLMKQKKYSESVAKAKYEKLEFIKNYNRRLSKIQVSCSSPEIVDEPLKESEHFKKLSSENELILCTGCKVSKNTWLGRDFVELESIPADTLNDLVKMEHFISVQAAKQNELNAIETKTKPFTFLCELYITQNKPVASMLINLRPLQRTHFNPLLGIFLKDYVPKIMKRFNCN